MAQRTDQEREDILRRYYLVVTNWTAWTLSMFADDPPFRDFLIDHIELWTLTGEFMDSEVLTKPI